MTPAEKFRYRMSMWEYVQGRGFFLGNGLYLVYYPDQEEIWITHDRGTLTKLGRVDVALLRRLLDQVEEFSVPSTDERYIKELQEITKE